MEQQNISIDNVIMNLAYYYLENAIYLSEVMNRTAKILLLDEDLTPEQKRALKEEAGFTSKMIQNLSQAKRLWRQFCSVCDILLTNYGAKLDVKLYDKGQATAAAMLAMDLVYFTLGSQSIETAQKIHDYLKTFQWPEELKSEYETLMRRSLHLR